MGIFESEAMSLLVSFHEPRLTEMCVSGLRFEKYLALEIQCYYMSNVYHY